MKRSTVFLGVFVAVLSAATLRASADEYSYQRTLDTTASASGARALAVTGYNGNIHLYADGGDSVKIHAVLKARSEDAVRDLNVAVKRAGNTVDVEDVCPATRNFIFWTAKDCDIELDVHYPAAFAVSVDSENGNIVSEGANGSLTFKNHNGNVTIERAGGAVSVANTNGNVIVALAKSWRGSAIDLHSNAGNVHLSVPSNFAATYVTKTTLGNVRNNAATRSGGPTVTATTTFGNVVISQQ
jgi:hypothetical protein